MVSFQLLLIFAVVLLQYRVSNGLLHHHYDRNLMEAELLINKVLQPANCTGLEYVVVTIGINGGFAAQFQYVGAEWMRAFAAVNYSKPVIIQGHIKGYSEGKECAHVKNEWTCFFLPMSTCEDVLIKTGKRIDIPHYTYDDNLHVPPSFKHLGLAYWWGVVQHRMFRFQPFVEDFIAEEAKSMLDGRGFPYGLPIVGLHVRHGDKHVDGFHEHSLVEELCTMQKSSDCFMHNTHGDCFAAVNFSNARFMGQAFKALEKNQTIIIKQESMNLYNRTIDNSHISIPKKLLPLSRNSHSSGHVHSIVDNVVVSNDTFLLPLHVFVASDDKKVLQDAAKLGFMYDADGVSQTTGNLGMLTILLQHPEFGYNATLEIVSDIYFLSQCSTLLGISGSQVFRMSVALSHVTGILKYAVAMDTDQIAKVRQMSEKYHVPFPETFSTPSGC